MTVAELEKLLNDIESDGVKRTESAKDKDKICQAICAFSNDLPGNKSPGFLFIGARDDGSPSGLPITDRLLQALASIRSDGNVLPLPVVTVCKETLKGAEMAVVSVLPSDLPPVKYKNVIYVRVGPTTRIAHESEERILSERRTAAARTWDARPNVEAALDDLALDLFTLSYRPFAVLADIIRENKRDMEQQLAALRFYDVRANRPTNAAVLMFAKDPLMFVPGAYIQLVQYDGPNEANRVLHERRLNGDLHSVMKGLDQLALQRCFGSR